MAELLQSPEYDGQESVIASIINRELAAEEHVFWRSGTSDIYAITNRRVLVIEGSPHQKVKSYRLPNSNSVRVTKLKGESGALEFTTVEIGDASGVAVKVSLRNIPQVNTVAYILGAAFDRTKGNK